MRPQTTSPQTTSSQATAGGGQPEEPRKKSGRGKVWFVAIFGAIMLFGGLFGFGGKIYKFILAWHGDYEARFALVPVAMYFAVAIGFACIFAWAVLNGMLADVEGPKYWMMENERELDEIEGRKEDIL